MANLDPIEPTREEIDQSRGPLVLEFGASWCPHCRHLASRLPALLAPFPEVRHRMVEDGPGRPLGRSFGVKLWPTLIFLLDGEAKAKAVRPDDPEIVEGLAAIAQRRPEPSGQDSSS